MTAQPVHALAPAGDRYEYLLTRPAGDERASAGLWRQLLVMALAVFIAASAAVALQWKAARDEAARIDIALLPAMPADLVAATRGEQAARAVTGERAEAINAALPFAREALESARPFLIQAASASDEDRALLCLTQAVYYEAGYEPIEGRRAVAQVVLNRVRHPAFPNSVCGVVYDGSSRPGCQFSFTCDGSLRRAPAAGAWAAARRVAEEALRGAVVASVGTATHYHANYVAPYWAPRLTKLQQIGAHIFYRWPGSWGRNAAFRSRYAGVEVVGMGLASPALADLAELPAAALLPPDPTDRRAPEDVGGRLDVTKGWTLSIPTPAEASTRLAGIRSSQSGAPAAPAMAAAAPAGVQGSE